MSCFKWSSIRLFTWVTFPSLFFCLAIHAQEGTEPKEIPARPDSALDDRTPGETKTLLPELATTPPSQTPVDEDWTTERVHDLLGGRADPPEGWPKRPVSVSVRSCIRTTDPQGKSHSRQVFATEVIDPSRGLSTAQRHSICSKQFETLIGSLRTQLNQSTKTDQVEELLSQLRNAYTARFRIDTVYQEIKVSEIERRAQKLRAEVDTRSEAEDSWVKAMLTLAEMKADGIEILPPLDPRTAPSQAAYGSRVGNQRPSFNDPQSQSNVTRATQYSSFAPANRLDRYVRQTDVTRSEALEDRNDYSRERVDQRDNRLHSVQPAAEPLGQDPRRRLIRPKLNDQ